jgi:hypothetical protein
MVRAEWKKPSDSELLEETVHGALKTLRGVGAAKATAKLARIEAEAAREEMRPTPPDTQ